MSPYTLDDAEQALRRALDEGDYDRITAAAADVDRLDTHTPPVPLAAAALWYAEQGLRVFPLRPGTKIPFAGSNGCLDASAQVDIVRGWWDTDPDSNIGIATGHLVDVVDFDGLPGQLTRARQPDLFDALQVLGTVSTPRPGGTHWFVPATGRGNKAKLLPGIDYRGKGGYVVAAPSVVTEGPNPGRYDWVRPLALAAAVGQVAA